MTSVYKTAAPLNADIRVSPAFPFFHLLCILVEIWWKDQDQFHGLRLVLEA
jgi:hypothetical protein